jgi:hypothetical protein
MSDRISTRVPIMEWPEAKRSLPAALCNATVYTMGACRIIVSNDPGEGWHLSISCVDRDPTWKEIATARYRLLPNVPEMAMYLPPLNEYVNLHPFTFHLYEVPRS